MSGFWDHDNVVASKKISSAQCYRSASLYCEVNKIKLLRLIRPMSKAKGRIVVMAETLSVIGISKWR
jgi:hypothetical protein